MLSLRSTKFFVSFYGDAVSEKQFNALQCCVLFEDKYTVFTFKLTKGLDFDFFQNHHVYFDTFFIDDVFLVKKFTFFLKENSQSQFFKLRIIYKKRFFEWKVKKMKVALKTLVFYS